MSSSYTIIRCFFGLLAYQQVNNSFTSISIVFETTRIRNTYIKKIIQNTFETKVISKTLNDLKPDGFISFFWYVLFSDAYQNAPEPAYEHFGFFKPMDCIDAYLMLRKMEMKMVQ